MKISAVLIISSLWMIHVRLSNAEYRFRRMPILPPPPRAPMSPYMKKWYNPNFRQPIRQRPIPPIPLHMGYHMKKPIGPPVQIPTLQQRPTVARPVLMPIKAIKPQTWSSQQFYQKQQEKKPFISSPTIPSIDYDYHIQTNQIPNHSNLIKQVDEKGPIHTIPAPNLSLADKPAHIEEVRPKQANTLVEIQHSHSYQVTESPSPDYSKKIYKQEVNQTPRTLENMEHQQEELLLTSHDQLNQISQQDLMKILQNYPQAQLFDNFGYGAQQPQLQQHILQQQNGSPYQALISQPFYQPENTYSTQTLPQREIKPEFLSFNYEEPTNKNAAVSAQYQLQPEAQEPNLSFYNTQPVNNVDQAVDNYQELNAELINGHYYSSLPSKDTADAFMALQNEGSRNSQVKEPKEGNKMTIYVPEDAEAKRAEYKKEASEAYDYDDASMEEQSVSASEVKDEVFGSRIKPKKA